MKRLGLGDLGAGRRKQIEGLVDFPTTTDSSPVAFIRAGARPEVGA